VLAGTKHLCSFLPTGQAHHGFMSTARKSRHVQTPFTCLFVKSPGTGPVRVSVMTGSSIGYNVYTPYNNMVCV